MLKQTLIAGAFALLTAGLAVPVVSSGANALPLAQTGSAPTGLGVDHGNIQTVAYDDWRKKRKKWGNNNRYKRDWRRHSGWNKREWRRNARWDRRYHGPRYSYRYGRYRHYHNGYYYASPWWVLAPFAYAVTAPRYYGGYGGYGSGHVQWCLNRYRSYDPASDTYMGYDGYRHRCYSPY